MCYHKIYYIPKILKTIVKQLTPDGLAPYSIFNQRSIDYKYDKYGILCNHCYVTCITTLLAYNDLRN